MLEEQSVVFKANVGDLKRQLSGEKGWGLMSGRELLGKRELLGVGGELLAKKNARRTKRGVRTQCGRPQETALG